MSAVTGVIRNTVAAEVPRVKKGFRSEDARRTHAIRLLLIMGVLSLAIVVMSAYAANLRRLNNELQAENAYIQAEIDSLEIKIGNATNINKIEKTAIEELGMVHPDSDNIVALGAEKADKTNLASTIKDEAYD